MTIGAGGFLLLGVASLVFLVTQIGNRGLTLIPHPMYEVTAKFDNIADLKVGAHVSMAGVDIGRVKRIDLDAVEQKAVVSMRLDTEFNRIPNDSSASIHTRGLLGGKFVSLTNGGSAVYLKDNDRIPYTRSALSLESVINHFVAHYLQSKSGAAASADQSADRPSTTP
ncbi:MAG TPA: outer membrane lipid asymmetry maintenance protein MlaD [Steroidobacteraceae bacterium]|nr:outer membrane lipid asymmetry maintenance protein MlaD [Steroidobacteraceae bacterium]